MLIQIIQMLLVILDLLLQFLQLLLLLLSNVEVLIGLLAFAKGISKSIEEPISNRCAGMVV